LLKNVEPSSKQQASKGARLNLNLVGLSSDIPLGFYSQMSEKETLWENQELFRICLSRITGRRSPVTFVLNVAVVYLVKVVFSQK